MDMKMEENGSFDFQEEEERGGGGGGGGGGERERGKSAGNGGHFSRRRRRRSVKYFRHFCGPSLGRFLFAWPLFGVIVGPR